MNKSQKSEIVSALTNEFKSSAAVIMCDYRGLAVSELEALRKIAREKDAKVQVVKNTLATIALNNAEMSGIEIKDTNIFVWGADAIAASKTAVDFAKANDKFVIRTLTSTVKPLMRLKFVHLLPYRDAKSCLECLHLFGWDQFATLQSDSMRLNAKKKKKRLNFRFAA
jgi:ribosomal protein L10